MLATLKALQLVTALALAGVAVMIFPGAVILPALAACLCYVGAALLAMRDYRIGVWLAFLCSVLTAGFTGYGVYRYVRNGFDFLAGTDGRIEPVHWPPYLFLCVATAALAVVLLHARAWRWLVRGEHPTPRS